MPKIITLHVGTGKYQEEQIADDQFLTGGRALSSQLVAQIVPPEADALGPDNILAFCCGVLAGTTITNANRISVGGKSPLTGTIKESNAGGTFAYHMGRLGIRSIICEGPLAEKDVWKVIHISTKGVKVEDGTDLAGSGCYDKSEMLTKRFGKGISFAIIGPVAEQLMRTAAIAVSDPQNRPSRFCGRGGMGAVMASKGIQAIVLDPSDTPPVQPQDKERFKAASRTIAELVNNTPQTAKVFRKYGTAAMIDVGQGLGFLPVNNFTRGRFEQSEQINGQALYDTISARGGEGKTSHACMPGCLVQCSNIYPDKEGKYLVSPLEYETIGLMGPNLGIGDLDVIAELNYIANDCGVDTVDSGAAIGVAMQAGLAEFGDSAAALSMMKEIRQSTILGKLLGSGAETTAKVLGVYQAPTAKGQAFPAYDPRAMKGLAATYATSPMGADHTAGHTIRSAVDDHHGFKGQAAASRLAQVGTLQWDSLGFCYFLGTALPDLSLLCEIIKAIHDKEVTPAQIRAMAVETLKTERDFNRKAGFGPAHDRLNEYFHKVKNPDTGTVCDIPTADITDLMDDNKLAD